MADQVTDCPDPCDKTPLKGCPNMVPVEGSNNPVSVRVNVKLASTTLVADACKCKDIINLDPEELEKLKKINLVIKKKTETKEDEETPTKQCPVFTGTTVELGQDGEKTSLNFNTGVKISLGDIVSEYISAIDEDANRCCLSKYDQQYTLEVRNKNGARCVVPKAIKQLFAGRVAAVVGNFMPAVKVVPYNEGPIDMLGYSTQGEGDSSYWGYNDNKVNTLLGDIPLAIEILNNITAIDLGLSGDTSKIDEFKQQSHPASGRAQTVYDVLQSPLPLKVDIGDGLKTYAGANKQFYFNGLKAKYQKLLSDWEGTAKALKALAPGLKDCYDFSKESGVLKPSGAHEPPISNLKNTDPKAYELFENWELAHTFLKDPCRFAKKAPTQLTDSLCKIFKCIGKGDKKDGKFDLNNLSVSLEYPDDIKLSSCYNNIPISANLSGTTVGGAIFFDINIVVGDTSICGEKEVDGETQYYCKDKYYAVIKKPLEVDFTEFSGNCYLYNEVTCQDVSDDNELSEVTSGAIDPEDADFNVENGVVVGTHTDDIKYGYVAYKCKKCSEIQKEIDFIKAETSGICCKEAEWELQDDAREWSLGVDRPKPPADKFKEAALKSYGYYSDKTDVKTCCDKKGHFAFTKLKGIDVSTPDDLKKENCLPKTICCVPEAVTNVGTCYHKTFDAAQQNSGRLTLTVQFDTEMCNITPPNNVCDKRDNSEQLYECGRVYPLFKGVERGAKFDTDKLILNIESLNNKAIGLPNASKPVAGGDERPLTWSFPDNGIVDSSALSSLILKLSNMGLLKKTSCSEPDKSAKIKYQLSTGKTDAGSFVWGSVAESTISDFVTILANGNDNTGLKILSTDEEISSLFKCVKVLALYTKSGEGIKKCEGKESKAQGRLGVGEPPRFWLRDSNPLSCTLQSQKDGDKTTKTLSSNIMVEPCDDDRGIYHYKQLLVVTDESGLVPAANRVKSAIREALKAAFKFKPTRCYFGQGDNDYIASSCMDENCCKAWCEENDVPFVRIVTPEDSGPFPCFGINLSSYNDENTPVPLDSSTDPNVQKYGFVEWSGDLNTSVRQNKMLDDLTAYIYGTPKNRKFKLLVNGKDISGMSVDEIIKLTPSGGKCPTKIVSYIVNGTGETPEAQIANMLAKCKGDVDDHPQNNTRLINWRYNYCNCFPENDDHGIRSVVAECDKEYSWNDYDCILLPGIYGSEIAEKDTIKKLLVSFEIDARNKIDTKYYLGKEILPDNDISLSIVPPAINDPYKNTRKWEEVSATFGEIKVTKQQLLDARLLADVLKQFTSNELLASTQGERVKVRLSFITQDKLKIGKCFPSGCTEIEAREVEGSNGDYIPSQVLCQAQTKAFRKYYEISLPVFSKNETGLGGVIMDATACTPNLCSGEEFEPLPPQTQEEQEPEDPKTPPKPEVSDDDIKDECKDEYNALADKITPLFTKLQKRLSDYENAVAKYNLSSTSEEDKKKLAVIIVRNYFGNDFRTGATWGGITLNFNQLLPAGLSHSPPSISALEEKQELESLLSQMDKLKERCKK